MNKQQRYTGNYFKVPNAIFHLGLHQTAISVYAYLMSIEDRRTYECVTSYSTIARHLNIAPNTVAKYVRQLVESMLVRTERTEIITKAGVKRNGCLKYHILRSSAPSTSITSGRWTSWSEPPHSREPWKKRSGWASSSFRQTAGRAHKPENKPF